MKRVVAENVFTVSQLLTPDECRNLIDRGESLGFQQASVRMASGAQMRPDIRDNDRAKFTDFELAGDLWKRCEPFVPQTLEGGCAVGLDAHFRFYRYDVGQRFKRHRDGVVERSPTERSRLTCLFYLNDGFRGGEGVGSLTREFGCDSVLFLWKCALSPISALNSLEPSLNVDRHHERPRTF
jgi:hypothetical protein